jgi:hypothetical protein
MHGRMKTMHDTTMHVKVIELAYSIAYVSMSSSSVFMPTSSKDYNEEKSIYIWVRRTSEF